MWGFSHIAKAATQIARTSQLSFKQTPAIHQSWSNLETTSLLARSLPLPLTSLSLFNLRELLEKSLSEQEGSSITSGLDLLSMGMSLLRISTVCSQIVNNDRKYV